MTRRGAVTTVTLLAIVIGASTLSAQFFGRRGFIINNDPPPTEFIIARWKYTNNGDIDGIGWSHDYPQAEQHIAQIISEATAVNIERMSYRVVELDDPEIFEYPFTYLSEPGEMDLTEPEVVNFREYIDRGGFIMVDDFDGQWALENLRRNLRRVFPDREMFRVTIDHEIFHIFYDIDALNVISPYAVPGEATFYGVANKNGDLAMIICFNNDVATFWGWIDQARYQLKPSIESLRLGINFALYALTH